MAADRVQQGLRRSCDSCPDSPALSTSWHRRSSSNLETFACSRQTRMVHGVESLSGICLPEPLSLALRTLQEMKAAKGGKGATVPQKKAREAPRRGLVHPSPPASFLCKHDWDRDCVPLRVTCKLFLMQRLLGWFTPFVCCHLCFCMIDQSGPMLYPWKLFRGAILTNISRAGRN